MRLWRGSSNLGPPPQGIRARAPWSLPLSDRHALFVAVPPWGRDQAGRRESRDAPEDLAEEAPCQAAFGQRLSASCRRRDVRRSLTFDFSEVGTGEIEVDSVQFTA